MDAERARELLSAERDRIGAMLRASETTGSEERSDEDDPGDSGDTAQELTFEGVDDAVATSLRERLAAIDRADRRLADGTYGRSVRSGDTIPDERLEADPTAELTVTEAQADVSSDG